MKYLKQVRTGRCSFLQTAVKWILFPYLGRMPRGDNRNFAWTRTAQLAAKHASQSVLHQGILNSVAQEKICPHLPHEQERATGCENLEPLLQEESREEKKKLYKKKEMGWFVAVTSKMQLWRSSLRRPVCWWCPLPGSAKALGCWPAQPTAGLGPESIPHQQSWLQN